MNLFPLNCFSQGDSKSPPYGLRCLTMMWAVILLGGSAFAVVAQQDRPPLDRADAKLRPDIDMHRLPKQFKPVDTQSVMGSPNPLPLEPRRAFPNLTFQRPVEATYANDSSNRLFVVEQRGVIYVFENREDVAEKQIFLDIQKVVSREGNEEGLLGLAFHPDFESTHEFFVYYSTRPRASVISRFKVSKENPNQADRDSEEELMRIDQPYSNHNGGSLRFGPDGYLYIGLGDGGLADDPHSHAQNLSTLLGSILRIDVNTKENGLAYAIPQDNPFVDHPDARGEIWAYGLRNVWRLAFDQKTGQLWAGDVGQDRVEEINLIVKGGNYGWNIREGFQPFAPSTQHKPMDLLDPLVEYARQDGQSVTGGLVYRGRELTEFQGDYFYGDYLSGNVWSLKSENDTRISNILVAETGLEIAAFGEDAHGRMLLCAFDGNLYELRHRELDRQKTAERFPRRLSQTGLFASVPDNQPVAGAIPYEMNVPFWSDYAVKDRYLVLPEQKAVGFDERDKWKFPVGTVFIKTFWMHMNRVHMEDPKRLETRLLVRAPHGWEPYTYVYNDDQTEAFLLEGAMTKPVEIRTEQGLITQPYYFPSRSDCFACHTKAEGFVLGMTTRQLNRTLHYRGDSENQIAMLDRLEIFENGLKKAVTDLETFPQWSFGNFDRSEADKPNDRGESEAGTHPLTIPNGDKDELARAWLEVNCAVCHRPAGIAPHERDLRFHAPQDQLRLIGQKPRQGQLSPPGSQLIKPASPFESELFLRINRRGPRQMPPLATHAIDPIANEVIRQWIQEMEARDAPAD
jgi:uncharacterized repeat protein (TIGR03806 family)